MDVKNIEEMDAQYVSTKTITGKRRVFGGLMEDRSLLPRQSSLLHHFFLRGGFLLSRVNILKYMILGLQDKVE